MFWEKAAWFSESARGALFLAMGTLLAIVGILGGLLGKHGGMGTAALVYVGLGHALLHGATQPNHGSLSLDQARRL